MNKPLLFIAVGVIILGFIIFYSNSQHLVVPATQRPTPKPFALCFKEGSEDTLVNLTPHDVVIYNEDGKNVMCTIPSQGSLRVQYNNVVLSPVANKIPVKQSPRAGDGQLIDKTGILGNGVKKIIVSTIVAQYMALNASKFPGIEVYTPDSNPGSAVRSPKGQILGVKGLIKYT